MKKFKNYLLATTGLVMLALMLSPLSSEGVTQPKTSGTQAVTGRVTGVAIDSNDSGEPSNKPAKMAKPDLRIKQFLFPPTNDKALRVHLVNTGQAPSGACRLFLTVRKINGVAVGRKTHVNVPALSAGADVWLVISATSILPNNVSLQSTTFKLNVDATDIVAESDESNNEVWHNLSAVAVPTTAETSDTQPLTAAPSEPSKLSCRNVSRRWQVCGSVSRTRFVAGVGIRFNQFDPNGRIVASRYYDDCGKLAADRTIPADIRAKAAGPCRQSLQVASREAAVQ